LRQGIGSLLAKAAKQITASRNLQITASRNLSHFCADQGTIPLISQPQLEFFSGKNFLKPNAINPLRAAPVLKSRV